MKRGFIYFFAALGVVAAACVGFVVHNLLSFASGREYQTTILAGYVGAVIAAIAEVVVSLMLKKTDRKKTPIIVAAVAIVFFAVSMTFQAADLFVAWDDWFGH